MDPAVCHPAYPDFCKFAYLLLFKWYVMKFGVIGSGSWATALTKVLTDNGQKINWWIRNTHTLEHIRLRNHNPHYLPSVLFSNELLEMSSSIEYVTENSDVLVIAVPAAFVREVFSGLSSDIFQGKRIVSAVKGILPEKNEVLNEYLKDGFGVKPEHYFTLLGPCHAEEVASEKLSYLTFSGIDRATTREIADCFKTPYLNTTINQDVMGVQYAAVLKNIYALGAGIAHGLEYGDNFLSVYIANAADEMVRFLQNAARHTRGTQPINYFASVYLGDLLVTCYSLYSRNRMFGNMIGKGYSVRAAQLELSMVAEGYNASKCIFMINQQEGVKMPMLEIIYGILWQNLPAWDGFRKIETLLV